MIFGLMATMINPTDPLSTLGITIENKTNTKFCSICKSSVQMSSKHCGKCDRCATSFDHHCIWLNNCIGQRNYRSFILALTGLVINSALITTFCTINLLNYYLDECIELEIHKKIQKIQSDSSWIAEVCILLAYGIASFILAGNLLCFHIWIKWKGITTVEYILNRRRIIMRKVQNGLEIETKSPESNGERGEIATKHKPENTEISINL